MTIVKPENIQTILVHHFVSNFSLDVFLSAYEKYCTEYKNYVLQKLFRIGYVLAVAARNNCKLTDLFAVIFSMPEIASYSFDHFTQSFKKHKKKFSTKWEIALFIKSGRRKGSILVSPQRTCEANPVGEIAHSFLHVMSELLHSIIFSLSR